MRYFFKLCLLALFSIPFLFNSCKKDPFNVDLHKDTTITGNVPPSYNVYPVKQMWTDYLIVD